MLSGTAGLVSMMAAVVDSKGGAVVLNVPVRIAGVNVNIAVGVARAVVVVVVVAVVLGAKVSVRMCGE